MHWCAGCHRAKPPIPMRECLLVTLPYMLLLSCTEKIWRAQQHLGPLFSGCLCCSRPFLFPHSSSALDLPKVLPVSPPVCACKSLKTVHMPPMEPVKIFPLFAGYRGGAEEVALRTSLLEMVLGDITYSTSPRLLYCSIAHILDLKSEENTEESWTEALHECALRIWWNQEDSTHQNLASLTRGVRDCVVHLVPVLSFLA